MALVNCPECNKEISDLAEFCPHCGFPFSKKKSIEVLKEIEITEQEKVDNESENNENKDNIEIESAIPIEPITETEHDETQEINPTSQNIPWKKLAKFCLLYYFCWDFILSGINMCFQVFTIPRLLL